MASHTTKPTVFVLKLLNFSCLEIDTVANCELVLFFMCSIEQLYTRLQSALGMWWSRKTYVNHVLHDVFNYILSSTLRSNQLDQ